MFTFVKLDSDSSICSILEQITSCKKMAGAVVSCSTMILPLFSSSLGQSKSRWAPLNLFILPCVTSSSAVAFW